MSSLLPSVGQVVAFRIDPRLALNLSDEAVEHAEKLELKYYVGYVHGVSIVFSRRGYRN